MHYIFFGGGGYKFLYAPLGTPLGDECPSFVGRLLDGVAVQFVLIRVSLSTCDSSLRAPVSHVSFITLIINHSFTPDLNPACFTNPRESGL